MAFFDGGFCWRKIKERDIPEAESFLRKMESKSVTACGRFLARNPSKDFVWALRKKKEKITALIVNSGNTLIPVLSDTTEVSEPDFLKSFSGKKNIHSVQGIKNEVAALEKTMSRIGIPVTDIFDYELMNLDKMPDSKAFFSGPSNLVLRIPQMTDMDVLAPLQAAYEQEEVIPKGSTFSPAASRLNISKITARGQILAAELNGHLVGKINISAVSFTRYQVGGVYVHPGFRGLGIARRMAAEFIASLINRGRAVTLFVKKNNISARKLYTGLGFEVTGDYRITYY